MKKLFLFAAVAGFGLCSGSPPNKGPDGPREARTGYPPCSRTVTDRCIQLRERGVRTRENLAHNRRADPQYAHGAEAAPAPAPTQTAQAAAGASGCRCARPRRHLSRRIRYAGERG